MTPLRRFCRLAVFTFGILGTLTDVLAAATPPSIIRQPVSANVYRGYPVVFKVTATGTDPLVYQWRFNGTNIAGATNSLLTFTSQSTNAGTYSVVITNSAGSVTSSNAVLTSSFWTTTPTVPDGVLLDWWTFDDTNWYSGVGLALGIPPVVFSNITSEASWSGNALSMDATNAAILQYTNWYAGSWPSIACDRGSVEFWFKPNWASTNLGGTGPGSWGRLIEVGTWTTNASNGFWGLYLNPTGTQITFSTQAGGVQSNYLTANISWTTNEWYHIALTYDTTNASILYLDGVNVTSGPPVTAVLDASVVAQGFRVGSDGGLTQARGQFENLYTFSYPLTYWEVAFDFADDWQYAAYWVPDGGGDDLLGGGGGGESLVSAGDFGSGNPAYTNVYILRISVQPTNSIELVSLTITNPTSGTLSFWYDILGVTNLLSTNTATNATWTWLGIGQNGSTVTFTNTLGSRVFYILGTPQDSDGDGLTDAYELSVSKSDPYNPASNADDGLSDWFKALLGLAAQTASSPQTLGSRTIYKCPQ